MSMRRHPDVVRRPRETDMAAPFRGAGFTPVELLVVIASVAVLAAIYFPVFAHAREKTR